MLQNVYVKDYSFHFIDFQLVPCHVYLYWIFMCWDSLMFYRLQIFFVDVLICSTYFRILNYNFKALSDCCVISNSLGIHSFIFNVYWMRFWALAFFINIWMEFESSSPEGVFIFSHSIFLFNFLCFHDDLIQRHPDFRDSVVLAAQTFTPWLYCIIIPSTSHRQRSSFQLQSMLHTRETYVSNCQCVCVCVLMHQ